jgi:putative transposase
LRQRLEFIAAVLAEWCATNGAGTVFIEPGKPWQNAWIESYNGRLRDECLNIEVFDTITEAQVIIDDWRHHYNHERAHSAHGLLTPAEYAQTNPNPLS